MDGKQELSLNDSLEERVLSREVGCRSSLSLGRMLVAKKPLEGRVERTFVGAKAKKRKCCFLFLWILERSFKKPMSFC